MSRDFSPLLASAAGSAAMRENRIRQALAEAERRAQALRHSQQARRVADAAEEGRTDLLSAVPLAVEPAIGVDAAAMPPADAAMIGAGQAQQGEALAHLSCVLGVLGELLQDGAGAADDDGADAAADEVIIGSSDRVPAMALKTALIVYPPLPLRHQTTRLPALRPAARGECERRCNQGAPGFCDPSSELGCGGEFCGAHQRLLQELSAREQAASVTPVVVSPDTAGEAPCDID